MQYYLLTLISVPFLYINYKIIKSDLNFKKIPNKNLLQLLILIPIYYIYIFYFFEFSFLFFWIQFFLTFIISFILYYFWIWSAWDAKYLLVLSLFIPYIWIISFITNIALLTIFYLFLYFIWFYLWKCLLKKNYLKELLIEIKKDINDKWLIYKEKKSWNNISIILKWLITFLIIFITLRISRIYILKDIIENSDNNYIFQNFKQYIIIGFIIFFIATLILVKKIYIKVKEKIKKKYIIEWEKVDNYSIIIISVLLIFFIIYELIIDYELLINSLKLILTFYILLFIIFVILKYSYKIVFQISESEYINIKKLKVWDIIDKEYFINMFSWQDALIKDWKWLLWNNSIKKINELVENPITNEWIKNIRKIYSITNKYNIKNKIWWFTENQEIKILKTFPFAWYIFTWFIITFVINDYLIIYITEKTIQLIK